MQQKSQFCVCHLVPLLSFMQKLVRSDKSLLICLLERIRVSINTWRMTLIAAPNLAPAHGNALQLCSQSLWTWGKSSFFSPQFQKHEIHHWPLGKAGWLRSTWWEKEAAGESGEHGGHGGTWSRDVEGKKRMGQSRKWELRILGEKQSEDQIQLHLQTFRLFSLKVFSFRLLDFQLHQGKIQVRRERAAGFPSLSLEGKAEEL